MVWNRFLIALSLTASLLFGSVAVMSATEVTETETETSSEVVVGSSYEKPYSIELTEEPFDCLDYYFLSFTVNGKPLTFRYLKDNPDFYIEIWSQLGSNNGLTVFSEEGSSGSGTIQATMWQSSKDRPSGTHVGHARFSGLSWYENLTDDQLDSLFILRVNAPTSNVIWIARSPLPSVFENISKTIATVATDLFDTCVTFLTKVMSSPLALYSIAIVLVLIGTMYGFKVVRGM